MKGIDFRDHTVTTFYSLGGEVKSRSLIVGATHAKRLVDGPGPDEEATGSYHAAMIDLLTLISLNDKCYIEDIDVIDIIPYTGSYYADLQDGSWFYTIGRQPVCIKYMDCITGDTKKCITTIACGDTSPLLDETITFSAADPRCGDVLFDGPDEYVYDRWTLERDVYNDCREAAERCGGPDSIVRPLKVSPTTATYRESWLRGRLDLGGRKSYNGHGTRSKSEELTMQERHLSNKRLEERGVVWYGKYYGPIYEYNGRFYEVTLDGEIKGAGIDPFTARYKCMKAHEERNIKRIHSVPDGRTLDQAYAQSLRATPETDITYNVFVKANLEKIDKAPDAADNTKAWAELLKDDPDACIAALKEALSKDKEGAA